VKRTENKGTRRLVPGRGGWAAVQTGAAIGDIWVKFRLIGEAEKQARFKIVDLIVRATDWNALIDVAALRAVPVAWIETEANMPDVYWQLYNRLFDSVHLELIEGNDPGLEQFVRGADIADIEPAAVHRAPFVRLPKVPAGAAYPDTFYERVAVAYRAYMRMGVAPAQRIAEDSSAPVSTVHRWIREARRRGHLAPARSKGRPG
jgi:hypothetical protein